MRTRVKICCIANDAEAELAIAHGADAIGLVGPMPSGPGRMDLEEAAEVVAKSPPPVATFLLTAEERAKEMKAQVDRVRPTAVQLVKPVEVAEVATLAGTSPSVRRIQVIHVQGPEVLEQIDAYAPHVHAFLLDSGRPSATTPELGGTGRTHDWSVSRAFVERSPLPVFLAGGLRPENVREAIQIVRPYAVDVCSGVRREGKLSGDRLQAFMRAVASADADQE